MRKEDRTLEGCQKISFRLMRGTRNACQLVPKGRGVEQIKVKRPQMRATNAADVWLRANCNIGAMLGLLLGSSPAPAQSWITTNTIGWYSSHTNEWDVELTPSLSTNVPNSAAYYNKAARIFVHAGERVIIHVKASATYGGKIVASYDIRASSPSASSRLSQKELHSIWQANRVLLKADYFRGRVYYPGWPQKPDEWATVFSSMDGQRIVAVSDSGPINCSMDAGLSWSLLSQPGEYAFALSSTPAGTKVIAALTVPDLGRSNTETIVQGTPGRYWSSVASSADGKSLVLTGGAAESAPILSISHEGDVLVLSWPTQTGAYGVQQTLNISTPDWQDITNAASVVGADNQLRLPASIANSFFRLKKR
jgi:hypothetical protein